MLRGVLRSQPERGEPRDQPLLQRDPQRGSGDAGVHDNGDVVGQVGEENVDDSDAVV